ncbi:Uncharacterized protein HZ326_29133, partial [Fusarium oxysporum f. sp. albedinis]
MRRSPRKHRSTRANERDPFESDTDHLEIVGQDVTPRAKRDLPYRHRDPEKQTHQQSQSVYPPPLSFTTTFELHTSLGGPFSCPAIPV